MGGYLRGKSCYMNLYEDGKRYTERVGDVLGTCLKFHLSP